MSRTQYCCSLKVKTFDPTLQDVFLYELLGWLRHWSVMWTYWCFWSTPMQLQNGLISLFIGCFDWTQDRYQLSWCSFKPLKAVFFKFVRHGTLMTSGFGRGTLILWWRKPTATWTKHMISFCQSMKLSLHTSVSFQAHWCAAAHSLGNPALRPAKAQSWKQKRKPDVRRTWSVTDLRIGWICHGLGPCTFGARTTHSYDDSLLT